MIKSRPNNLPKLRIRLEGNHSDYHCGSQAVAAFLTSSLSLVGDLVGDSCVYDVLVMNGEGSMHHGSRAFRRKMTVLREAIQEGRRAFLVNSVWQENPSDFDDVLNALDGIWVRGPLSMEDLWNRHRIRSSVCVDLSYFASLQDISAPVNFGGAAVITDLFSHELGGFIWPSVEHFRSMPRLDLRAMDWSELVASLRTASVCVTGRHHAMLAACRARTPFVLFEGNSHKFDDFLAVYGKLSPPRCRSFRDVERAVAQATAMQPEFDALFDWLEQLPIWTLPIEQ